MLQWTHTAASSMKASAQDLQTVRSVYAEILVCANAPYAACQVHGGHLPKLQAVGDQLERLQAAKLSTEQELSSGKLLWLC